MLSTKFNVVSTFADLFNRAAAFSTWENPRAGHAHEVQDTIRIRQVWPEKSIVTSAVQFVLAVSMMRVAVCSITPMIIPHHIPCNFQRSHCVIEIENSQYA